MNNFIKKTAKTKFLVFVSIFTLLLFGHGLAVDGMSSDNYIIEFDSINVGGTRSTSESYIMEDTIGEIGTGFLDGETYNLHAGYQQMNETYIAISVPSSENLTPAMAQPGDSAEAVIEAVATTDNLAGYTLSVRADTTPALQSENHQFEDYDVAQSEVPDFEWSIDSQNSFFGFTPEGSDVSQKFLDDGQDCDTGSQNTQERCWYFFSETNETISQSTSSNHPEGTTTDVRARAQIGQDTIQEADEYSANIIFTVVPN